MFTPGPLGLSALRVFLESRPDFSNGPRGFFSLLPLLLCCKPLSSPTPPSSVPDEADRGLGWQGTPPPSPPPLFPTHSASLALHLLDLNGSWECCDVMLWCIERTAFLPHPVAVPSSFTSSTFPCHHLRLQYPSPQFIFSFSVCLIVQLSLEHFSCSLRLFTKASHGKSLARSRTECEGEQSNSFTGRDSERSCAVRPFCVKSLFWQLPFKRE